MVRMQQLGGSYWVISGCKKSVNRCPNENLLSIPKCFFYVDQFQKASEKSKTFAAPLGSNQGPYKILSAYFRSEIDKLKHDKKATLFLQDLEKRLNNPKKFNLWDFTLTNRNLRGFKNKKMRALRLLSVFLQRALVSTHGMTRKQAFLVASINKLITKRMKKRTMEGYPRGVEISNRGIYHFYANAFMADKMMKRGVPTQYAASIAWTVNKLYEETLSHSGGEHSIRDIFAGYAGIAFLLKDYRKYSGPNWETFRKAYDKKDEQNLFIDHIGIDRFCNYNQLRPVNPNTLKYPADNSIPANQ